MNPFDQLSFNKSAQTYIGIRTFSANGAGKATCICTKNKFRSTLFTSNNNQIFFSQKP